jgi:dienelactone hydrolase
MRRRLAVLVVAAFAAAGCGADAGAATTWAGSFRLPAGRRALDVSLTLDGARATVSLAAGHAGATDVAATVRGKRIRFALPGRPARLLFDGRVRGRTLAGSVRQGALRGTFRVVRGSAGVLPYLGLYRGGAGAATLVVPEGLAPWLAELPGGAIHGLGPRLTVGARLGDTAGDGSLAADAAGLTWTRGDSTVRYDRVPLRQEEVRFGALAGTLTLPAGTGPFPAVAMVHGSGVQTRAELQTFVFFAALHGIAVLAYDKRGVGQSGGAYPGELAAEQTIDVLAQDAQAAVRFLARQPEVDARRVGLLGDSQAGWIIALAAAREPAVGWAVALAGPTIDVGRTDAWGDVAGKGESPPSAPLDRLEADVRARPPSGFDPRPFLARLAIPALWIYGDSDRNVPTSLCVEALEQLVPGHDYSWVVLHTTHTLLDLPSGLNRDIPRSRGFAVGLYGAIEDWLRRHGLGV